MNHTKHILAIDDTESIRVFLRISMQACGFQFSEAATAKKGVEAATSDKPDLVILDLGLPDRDGLDILPEIKALEHNPKVIILSVRKDLQTQRQALTLGADAYISKPFMMDMLLDTINKQIIE